MLADIEGPDAIQQFWISLLGQAKLRCQILRFYWDDQEHPAVEVPLGDFFCNGWGPYSQVSPLAVCQNPARGYNCYWEMPIRKRARVTLENRDDEPAVIYY